MRLLTAPIPRIWFLPSPSDTTASQRDGAASWSRSDTPSPSGRPADLQDLPPRRPDRALPSWLSLFLAVFAGALLVAAVGAFTDVFDDDDRSAIIAAYDDGFGAGSAQAAELAADELVGREASAFIRGQASARDQEKVVGLSIQQLLAAQEAGAIAARAALEPEFDRVRAEAYDDGFAAGLAAAAESS